MSLLLPADVAGILPGVAATDAQGVIDKAEASLAQKLGRRPYQTPTSTSPLETSVDITQGGAVDGATPPARSPLGQQIVTDLEIDVVGTTRFVRFPEGPVQSLRRVAFGTGTALDPSELQVRPWWFSYRDPRERFVGGDGLVATFHVGYLRTNFPAPLRQALELEILLAAGSAFTAATSVQQASGAVLSEQLRGRRTQYGLPGGSSDTTAERAEARIQSLIEPYAEQWV